MRCTCGFNLQAQHAPRDHLCSVCGSELNYDTDDFLLHGANDLIKDVRPGQVEMGRLIEKALDERGIAAIEGPVGIGKSFAYLLPAMLSKKRVIISTAKKQLQHQLILKDLPLLAAKIGRPVKFAIYKGKSNYACRRKTRDEIESQKEREVFDNWLYQPNEVGDLTSYQEKMGAKPKFWQHVTAEDCVGEQCKHARDCGYYQTRLKMKLADVVVVNHNLVAYDLRFGPNRMLGQYDALVIDEAHQAPNAFRGAYSVSVTKNTVKGLIRGSDKVGVTFDDKALEDAYKAMFNQLRHKEGTIPADPFGAHGDTALKHLTDILRTVKDELAGERGGADYLKEDLDDQGHRESLSERGLDLVAYQKSVERAIVALNTIKEPGDNDVIYVSTLPTGDKMVTVSPINVGSLVGPKLVTTPTVIVTSATLTVGGRFDDIIDQLGLNRKPAQEVEQIQGKVSVRHVTKARDVETLRLESPFNYHKQALLYAPKHLPLPPSGNRDPVVLGQYWDAIAAECTRLIRASGGNTFVLFSSTTDMTEVHKRVSEADLPHKLITQGSDAEAALREYMNTPHSVIFGLKSFWEGVDVQGDKLRLVIIAKLPFPIVSDPVLQARNNQIKQDAMAQGSNEQRAAGLAFTQIQVPLMVTDLRQGAGRLIRSKRDRGVCAILDPRVWTGSSKRVPFPNQQDFHGYGATAVESLGFSQRVSDYSIVERYLDMLRKTEKK